MTRKHAVVAAAGLALFAGCQSSGTSNADVKAALAQGVIEIRGSHDKETLHAQLLRTLARLRAVRATTPARNLAIRGFASTLRGLGSQLAFIQNDSGNIEAATRGAKRADRSLERGANLLRAAGRALGVQVGTLNGY